MKAPYLPLYTSDFLQGTLLFDAQEVGAYILLMCYQWDNGAIPSDEKSIKKIAKISQKKLEKVLKKFTLTPDNFYKNDRVEKERIKYANKSAKATDSVNSRWGKNTDKTDTNVLPTNNERITPVILPNHTIPNKVFTNVNTNTPCALEKKISSFFNLNELQHYQQLVEVGQFVHHLNRTGKEKTFEPEFDAYCAYKTASGDKIHTLRKFLGTPEKMYTDGGWCADNWQEALKKYNSQKNGHNQGYTPKTAITTGATRKNF